MIWTSQYSYRQQAVEDLVGPRLGRVADKTSDQHRVILARSAHHLYQGISALGLLAAVQ